MSLPKRRPWRVIAWQDDQPVRELTVRAPARQRLVVLAAVLEEFPIWDREDTDIRVTAELAS